MSANKTNCSNTNELSLDIKKNKSVNDLKYRHELKYLCSIAQIYSLINKISSIMPLDSHTSNTKGRYNISSLYFDDLYNSCYYENESGINPRQKFRIRIYNNDISRISLEVKRKNNYMTNKTSCIISESQCRKLMEGKVPEHIDASQKLLEFFCSLVLTRMMKPSIIVSYERIPYIFDIGNVRVTFDLNIESSTQTEHFLDGTYASRPIMPIGQHIMEVKYDEIMPSFIMSCLQTQNLQQTTFSKYYLCKKINLLGGLV